MQPRSSAPPNAPRRMRAQGSTQSSIFKSIPSVWHTLPAPTSTSSRSTSSTHLRIAPLRWLALQRHHHTLPTATSRLPARQPATRDMTARTLTSDHVNYLVWRYVESCSRPRWGLLHLILWFAVRLANCGFSRAGIYRSSVGLRVTESQREQDVAGAHGGRRLC